MFYAIGLYVFVPCSFRYTLGCTKRRCFLMNCSDRRSVILRRLGWCYSRRLSYSKGYMGMIMNLLLPHW